MKKIRQWLSDRRDRKLRERLVFILKNYSNIVEGYYFITGKKPDQYKEAVVMGNKLLSLKENYPEAYKKVEKIYREATMPRPL